MLTVGQKLWYVPTYKGEPHEVEVTKIGRKWATVGKGWQSERVDLVTFRVDGKDYASPGTCYLDREAYEDNQARIKSWQSVKNSMGYIPPEGVTLADIETAKKLLGFN